MLRSARAAIVSEGFEQAVEPGIRDFQKLNYSMSESGETDYILPPLLPHLTKVIVYFFSWKSPSSLKMALSINLFYDQCHV